MSETILTVTENGPYKLQGPLPILDHTGKDVRGDKATVFLCRCGGSQNKPFCDGTHSRIGFQGAERAVAEAAGRA